MYYLYSKLVVISPQSLLRRGWHLVKKKRFLTETLHIAQILFPSDFQIVLSESDVSHLQLLLFLGNVNYRINGEWEVVWLCWRCGWSGWSGAGFSTMAGVEGVLGIVGGPNHPG